VGTAQERKSFCFFFFRKRRFFLFMIGRRNLLCIAGASIAAAPLPRVLRIQNDVDIQNLDPANRHGWYDELVLFAVQSGLCQYSPGTVWGWRLDAAEHLVQRDALTTEFALRPGRQWTGGFGEMTAEDVKFSFERFLDPKIQATYLSDWDSLDRVEITGRYTGLIHLKRPFAPLFSATLPGISGTIVCRAAMLKAGGTVQTDPVASSGPYRIGSWRPRELLHLVRNPLWAGEKPWFDEIEVIPMDFREAETAFDSGDLDVTRIGIGAIPLIRDAHDPGTALTIRPALDYNWLGMNMAHPKLADPRVRRAIQQAVDVPDVLQAAFGDAVAPALGLVPPPLLGARTRKLYHFDPPRAHALLKEAGVTNLSLRIDFEHDIDRMAIAQVIQSQLHDVGITVRLHPMDEASFAAEGQESEGESWRDLQLSIEKFTASPDPSSVLVWFTCRQVGIWNTERYCDSRFDGMVAEAVAEENDVLRAAKYVDLQDMLEESGAFLPLYHGVNAWACRSGIAGAWSPDGQWPFLRDIKAI
jgi:peptide/nickel transport system substrate-binding protein